jgi:hypothetical protein
VEPELEEGWTARAQELSCEVLRPVQSDMVRLRIQLTPLELFEPIGDVVFSPEIIDNKAYPARRKDNNRADNLTNNRDGLLANVNNRQDGEDKSDKVDN